MAAALVAPRAFVAGFFVLFLLVLTTQFRFEFLRIARQIQRRINPWTCSRAREFSKAKQNCHKNLLPRRRRFTAIDKVVGGIIGAGR
jgi:hypothetical protein